MNQITFPLKLRMKGSEVANLQAALQLLIERGVLLRDDETARGEQTAALQRELAKTTFGSATRKLIALFQAQNQLPAAGEVDESTSEALNAKLKELGAFEDAPPDELPEFQHLVRGQVRYEDGLPIAGLKVQAFDRRLRQELTLGETTTDADGRYAIYYSVQELRRTGRRTVCLLVRALGKKEGEREESVLAESDVVFEAGIVEKINLRVPGGLQHAWSEYEQLMTEIEPLLEGAPVSSLSEDEKQQDVSYLSGKLNRDVRKLAQLAGAHKLAERTGLPPEILFGLAREQLPLKLSALLAQSARRRRNALTAAIREHIIPGRLLDELDRIEARFRELVAHHALEGAGEEGGGPLGALLGMTGLPKPVQARFAAEFVGHRAPVPEFWKKLRGDPQFRGHVDELQFAFQLSALTANHVPLMRRILRLQRTGDIRNVRDLARFNADDWKKIVLQPDDTGKATFPPEIAGKDDDEKAGRYAEILTRMVEDSFPVESLAQRMQRPGDNTPAGTRAFFKNVLDRAVSFDLGRATIDAFLKDNPALLKGVGDVAALGKDLKARQRLFNLVPWHEQMVPLLDAGLTSASAVNRMGRLAFAAEFGPQLGGKLASMKIHAKAGHITAAALNVLANLGPWFRFPMNVLPWSAPGVDGLPDWETLFGPFDFCTCDQCRSVHSPAAYLAELLAFLKQRKVKLALPGGATADINMREALFRRRPDLGDIELTCENTNLRLPYVDLTNEILENAIRPFQPFLLPPGAPANLDARSVSPAIRASFVNAARVLDVDASVVVVKAGEKWLVTDRRRLYSVRLQAGQTQVFALGYQTFGTENDLAANPSHVNADAYAELASSVHPWSLPLDLWVLETRVWLEKAGVERAELMRAFQPRQAPVDPSILAVACETLGLTRKEMEIVTGVDPHPLWEFWGLEQAGNQVEIPDPADPAKTVSASLGWVAALGYVRPFLRQSGLGYDELLRLIATRFVNPAGEIRIESLDSEDTATCDTSKLAITNLTAQVLDRLHRFVRLWRRLGWTIRELDLGIAVFQGGNPDPNARLVARLIEQLAVVKRVNQEIGVPLERLLSLWGTIDTRPGLRDDPAGEDSLYDKLFLNPSVLKPVDGAFVLNAARSEVAVPGSPLAAHVPAIIGGLGITATDLTGLTAAEVPGSDLTLANLSALHGRVTLANGMGLSIGEFVRWRSLSGINPFDPARPEDTLGFIEAVRRVTAAGFSVAEVDYLLRHQLDADPALAPTAETIAVVLTETRAGLQKIQDSLTLESDLNGDLTRKYLGLLKWDPAHVELAVSTLNSNPAFSAALEELPASTVFPPTVQPRVAWDSVRRCLAFAGVMTAADRAALLGVAVPPAAQANYQAAVEQLFRQSSNFLDAVRAYERPVFRVALVPASMPAGNFVPRRLRSRFFYDRKAGEVCFSGLMLAQDYAEISAIPGVDAAFTSALDQLRLQSSAFVPVGENEFFAEAEVTPLLAAAVTPPERFQAVLERLVPQLRRLLGESLVKQKLSEALGAEPAALGHLLDGVTMDGFLAPEFAESNAALGVDAARFPALFDAFARLSKGLLVAGKLGLDVRQLEWYFRFLPTVPARDVPWASAFPVQAGWLDFRDLPLSPSQDPVPARFAALLRLIALRETRDQIRPAGELAQEEIFAAAREPVLAADLAALTDRVAAILKRRGGWEEDGTKALCGAAGVALVLPADLLDEFGVVRLVRCRALARRINALPDQAGAWAREEATGATAQGIKQALRARHGEEAWQQIARPAQDIIREAKRAALVAYLQVRPPSLVHPDGVMRPAWHDANGLFAYFLIDVEMTPCWTTSRIKQAISSVQLFVQRSLLNLEVGLRIDARKDDAWLQWKWMKNYRVWEANRKIFLYPENWIEPELRDDKTPFFKTLENELLQNELTAATAEDAFLHYLERLDAVAKLELVGMYQQDTADGQQPVLHVFGRTAGTPPVYYYRRKAGSGRWTPWETVDLDIEGDHLIPIAWNRRLYLFWPVFSIKAKQEEIYPKDTDGKPPSKYFEIQLAWSEYKQGRWLPKKITSKRILSGVQVKEITKDNPDDDGRNDHVFFTSITVDKQEPGAGGSAPRPPAGLRIWPEWDNPQCNYSDLVVDDYRGEIVIPQMVPFAPVETFLFSGCHADAAIESGRSIYGVFNPSGTRVKAMRFEEGPADVPLRLPVDATTVREEDALGTTPGSAAFELLYPHQDYFLTGHRPFFFQDQSRSFLVKPVRLPVSSFKWHVFDSVDPGQIHAVKEHYYAWAGKGQLALRDAARAARWRPEARALAGTRIQALTQRDLQIQHRKVNALAASPWLDVKQLLAPEMLLPLLRRSKRYRFQAFCHPYVCDFIKALNGGGVDELLTLDIQESRRKYFVWTYHPKGLVDPDYPLDNVDFTPGGAYSQYNWELFFHVPMLIAARLSQNQRFEDAQRWFHYVFDPTNASGDDAPRKFWCTKPFHDLQREDYLKQRIEQLVKPSSSGAPNPELALEIEEWRNNPFSPHAVARLRLTAYQKSVVMKYLDNVIAWADQLVPARHDRVHQRGDPALRACGGHAGCPADRDGPARAAPGADL